MRASPAASCELHFLPGYAPELNPDELVWNYVSAPVPPSARSPLEKRCKTASRRTCSLSRAIEHSFDLSSMRHL